MNFSNSFARDLILFLIILAVFIFPFVGCSNGESQAGYQLNNPKKGEEIAIIKTNMGEIKIRFFENEAPKAVENFKKHSEAGYYDGQIFHRVINDFMIQGGDPTGTGRGGESIWGSSFQDEFSDKLMNLRGAVSMANSGKNTNGSQFFINQKNKESFEKDGGWAFYEKNNGSQIDFTKITDQVKKSYQKNGGNPSLDGAFNKQGKGHTVFAQVFEGMDIVDMVAIVPVDKKSNRPITDVRIEKIEISNY